MTNFDLSLHVFSFLQQAEVDTLVVCAGARNAPMVLALQEQCFEKSFEKSFEQSFKQSFKIYNYFEERSAAFFALGLIKATKKPVAILTTSGTAAAELLPAAIEAYYQGLPLILITADRPKSYRGTGSPQTIKQVGLFSEYVEAVYDLDIQTAKFNFEWSQHRPIHLNVAFAEPLIDRPSRHEVKINFKKLPAAVAYEQSNSLTTNDIQRRPIIILGGIAPENTEQVVEFILQTKAPVYAESLSQLKNIAEIKHYLLDSSEVIIKKIFKLNLCDAVIRIGGVPTLRFWRDLEGEFKNTPVTSFTDLPFSGLSRTSNLRSMSSLKAALEFSADRLQQIKGLDAKLEAEKKKLLNKHPLSEQSLTNKLAKIIKKNSLYLGNSLPIRNWDQFAKCESEKIAASRGANGIDGQVSTYLGWSEYEKKSYCYIGDLTAMYDLVSLGLMPQLQQNQRNIIVCNNSGGQIFNRVFKNDQFINAHAIKFEHWAQMWNWNYLQISDLPGLEKIQALTTPFNIIEIIPNSEQTHLFWNEWDAICQNL